MVYSALSDDSSTVSQFTRRKAITVTTTGTSVPASYQVKLTITHEPEMQADFDDIRFNTRAGGYIDYWIESYVASTSAVVWVELPDAITDPGSDTIWMYYGNSGLSDGSDGADVFIVFDDFEDALQGDWTTRVGTVDYTNTDHAYSGTQCMKLNSGSASVISVTPSSDIVIRYRIWKTTLAKHYFWHSDTTWVAHIGIPADEDIDYYDTAWRDTGDNLVPDQWELMEIEDFNWSGHIYDIIRNGVSSFNDTGMWNYGVRAQNAVELQSDVTGNVIYIDDFIVRKYIVNEPTPSYGTAQHQRRISQFIG